jgi:hypothetical protein
MKATQKTLTGMLDRALRQARVMRQAWLPRG